MQWFGYFANYEGHEAGKVCGQICEIGNSSGRF